jgi:hypothetical protein
MFRTGGTSADGTQIGLVYERRGLERMTAGLVGHAGGRQLPRLGVDEREQVGRRARLPAAAAC